MEGKTAKILAVAAGIVLVALELTLFLCFRLSRPFYLSTAVILSVVLAGTVAALLCQALSPQGRAERMARRSVMGGSEEGSVRVEYSFFRKVAGLPCRFSLEALTAATDDFQCVVGRGSSGTVFKGILDDGTAVAVKRIDGSAHVDKEFRSEVSAIGGVQHVSLVRLLGFCLVRNGPRFLVYEYMENGSLDKWIFPQNGGGGGGRCLTWLQRYQVAVDVAKALAYLHHDCRAKVVHLDVKPENILLDDCLRGMLSDFGLSTLMGKEQSRVVTTVRGTTGYLAPEWLLGAGVTEKSDVYSYGMVLMEMLGGRRNLQAEPGPSGSRRWTYFPKLVADRAREGRVMEVLDRRLLSSSVDEAGVRRLAHVALWCAQEKGGARPTMARVVEMLEARGGAAVEPPPPTDMIVVDLLALNPSANTQHGGAPLGLPTLPPGSAGTASSVVSMSDSFALSYLSGR
ncbi:putative receptor-like protein kinase [Dichanthelium oligosanthes]|uniref:Putative receptor-like protein kinase n=1 Tax=Dichanthelium oligosanthes TaxID=888268 RepID=A0A1E5W9L9_9POAL|nr:putative receptor-like protein kinase [Dichanthelium oligosanthes]